MLLIKLDGIRAKQHELGVLQTDPEGLISHTDGRELADCTDSQISSIIATVVDPAEVPCCRPGGTFVEMWRRVVMIAPYFGVAVLTRVAESAGMRRYHFSSKCWCRGHSSARSAG